MKLEIKLILTLLLFSAFTALGAEWQVNKDHSEVMFQVPYLEVSEVSGRFTNFSGHLSYDRDVEAPREIVVKIDVNSIETGNKLRDGHLRSSEFLDGTQYPEMIFRSQSVRSIGPLVYEATGTLTIKKISKPFKLEFTLTKSVKDTWGYENRFAKFKSSINRKDFGIKWNKTLDNNKYLVGDAISIWGTFQLQPARTKTPMSKHMIPDTKYMRSREEIQRSKDAEKPTQEESSLLKKARDFVNWK